jgi:hypothetical protein
METRFTQWLATLTHWRFETALGAVSTPQPFSARLPNDAGVCVHHITVHLPIAFPSGFQVSRPAPGFHI